MKKAIIIVCVFASLSIQKIYAQVLGVDGAGNSPIAHGGVSAGIDVLRSSFNASMMTISNNLYDKKNQAFGMTLNRIERGGISNLLKNGSTASVSSIGLSGAWVFSNEYENRYKPKQEYEKLLMDEKQALERELEVYKKDTALTFMVIRSLPSKYDMYKDSLKQLYFADGLSEKLFNNWVGYGQRVEDRMGEKGFAKEVMHLILYMRGTLLYIGYTDAKGKLNTIELQLTNINYPVKPFERSIVSINVGVRNFTRQNATFSNPLNTSNYPTSFGFEKNNMGFISIGLSYHYNNKVFFGANIGYDAYDNFEILNLVQYDTVKQFSGSGGQAVKSNYGYEGEYKLKGSVFFSARLTIIDDVPKMGKIVLTPLYFTFAARSTVGASVKLITRNGFSIGASAESFSLDGVVDEPKEKYNNYSFGFTVGYTLANLDFLSLK